MKSDSPLSASPGRTDRRFALESRSVYPHLDPEAILSQSEWSPAEKIRALLRFGVQKLNVDIGYVSHVDPALSTLSIVETSSSDPDIDDGSSYELASTFERHAITSSSPLSIHDTASSAWKNDRAPDHFQFGAYVGQKIVVDQQLYGVVSFACRKRRESSFTECDRTILRRVSDGVEEILTTPHGPVSNSRLAEDLDLLRRVQEVSKVGGWELHVDSGTLTWTDHTYRLHELSGDFEPDLESALAFYPGESQCMIENALERCLEQGVPFDKTVQLITAEGNRRQVRARGAPYRTNGKITHITGTVQDVSEQGRLEGELELQRNQFRKLVEHAESMVFILNADGDVLRAEGGTVTLFDREPEEYGGESAYDFFEGVPEIQSALQEALDGEPVEKTISYRGRTLDLRTAPYEDETRSPAGCIGIVADITEKVVMQHELEEERDLLRRVFETSPSAIAIINAEGQFVRVSDRAQEILGLEKDEVTDRTFNDPDWHITTPDGEPMPDENLPFARVRDEREPVIGVEIEIGQPDGNRRTLSVSGAPLHDAEGNFLGGVFHIDDITSQRQTKLSLQESEARFRGVFENSALGIALLDNRGRLIQANPALESMLGYADNPSELRELPFDAITHPEDVEADRKQFRQLLNGERTEYQMEKRYVRRDGGVFWGHLTVSRLSKPGDVELIGVVEDIDDRKAQQEKLRLFQKAVKQAGEAALILTGKPRRDPGPTVAYANPAFTELTGYDFSDVDGSHLEILFGQHTDSETLSRLWEALEQGSQFEAESILYRADGAPFISRWSIAPVRNEDDEITHWVTVIRDITQKRETGRQLLEVQNEERRRIDEEMHDRMGGLLTALQMTVDLARIEIEESGGPTDPLEKIEERVGDLATVARTISRRLHPRILADDGLAAACTSLIDRIENRYDVQIECRKNIDRDEPLSHLFEMTAYRVIQESILYAVRDTDASSLRVVANLGAEELDFRLEVKDSSFDASSSSHKQPLALRQLRRMVNRVDGTFSTGSYSDSAVLRVRLPLQICSLPST